MRRLYRKPSLLFSVFALRLWKKFVRVICVCSVCVSEWMNVSVSYYPYRMYENKWSFLSPSDVRCTYVAKSSRWGLTQLIQQGLHFDFRLNVISVRYRVAKYTFLFVCVNKILIRFGTPSKRRSCYFESPF